MAEIGLIASIIGVAGAGAKLSILIFDFASTIGTAGHELQDISTEISLLCSVLRQLENVLSHAHFRYSNAAVDASERILRKCDDALKEIRSIVSGLRSAKDEDREGIPSFEFVSKVKWTFQRSKVHLLRSTLESCKLTLVVLLSAMQVAEKTSMRRLTVTNQTASAILEDKQDKRAMQSFIISQQCSLDKLQHIEDQLESEEQIASQLPESAIQFSPSKRRRSRGRLVQMFSGLTVNTSTPSREDDRPPTIAERASVWLGAVMFGDEFEPHPGTQVRRRLSSLDTADMPDQLLRAWTDQGSDDSPNPDIWRDSTFSFTDSSASSADENSEFFQNPPTAKTAPILNTMVDSSIDLSPRSPTTSIVRTTTGNISIPSDSVSLPSDSGAGLGLEEESMDAMMTGSTANIKAAILRNFGSLISPAGHSLWLVCGQERTFDDSERPLEAFMQYKNLGLSPRLVICKDPVKDVP